MLEGVNRPLDEQVIIFEQILRKSSRLMRLLEALEEYAKTQPRFQDYYVAAGSINQTVFNYYHGFSLDYGIKDFDIVYFDDDLSYEAEDVIIKEIKSYLNFPDDCLDIKNEARVHLWSSIKYGVKREPYCSICDAISSWGSTVTCVGVRLQNGKFKIAAPYGLNDIFSMTIRPVKREFSKEKYMERAERWKKQWEKLQIIKWD